MNPNLSEVIFILDRSGSMAGLTNDTIGGYNAFIEEQKKDKADRRRKIEVFLCMLEEQKEYMRFEPYTFVALVDKVVVGQDRKLEIIFRNGMKYC